MSRLMRRQEGFTLVELMIVVLILGILIAIAVPVYLSATDNAKTNTCKSNLRTIDSAQSTYAAANEGEYALTLDALVGDSLKSIPRCPKAVDGAAGDYVVSNASDSAPFDVSCPNDAKHKL